MHPHPRLSSRGVTMSLHGTTGNGVSKASMPHGSATAHTVLLPRETVYPTAGSPPPCALSTTSRISVSWC